MRFALFGAGGVGGYFGGKLAEAGHDVTFIARGRHLQAMRSQGLRVDSIKGDFIVKSVCATDKPAEVGPVDVILVAVKAWQVSQAAEAMKPMVGPDTIVLPLENGVEAPAQIAQVLGWEHVLGGLCKIISYIVEPGHVRHTGVEPHIVLGELDNSRTQRVLQLRQIFTKAGISAEVPADIHAKQWEKFIFICSMSGLGAVTRAPIGQIQRHPGTRNMLIRVMEEIEAVARARHIGLPPDIIAMTMAFVDSLPEDSTASMQRDIMAGRPSELESQNGAVLRLGKEAGVETPLNAFIYNSLVLMEQKARHNTVQG